MFASYRTTTVLILCTLPFLAACSEDFMAPPDETTVFSGGATTIFNTASTAFSTPAPNLVGDRLDLHFDGDLGFEAQFVAAPAEINSGLGPVFNNNSCAACHPGDGRGRPPYPGETSQSLFLRISLPGSDPVTGGPQAVPGYGTQLFDKSIFGVQPQGEFTTSWQEEKQQFADNEFYTLHIPTYTVVNTYREWPSNAALSPRVAPPVFGSGLLEAIPEATLRAMADPNDADGDGISGRINNVWNYEKERKEPGRFGWKANNPTLQQQVAGAYNGDMGITSPYFPKESSHGSGQHDGKDDDPEISQETLDAVVFYVQTLGVPARRNTNDPEVRRGEAVFRDANCSGCHIETIQTGTLADLPEVSGQTIHPYTDLLLHDMGEGLADNREDYDANGREWRTPPLWGIGLTRVVNGHSNFLHDGRAQNLMEAIMWHGGEAENSREYVRNLSGTDRAALLRFLESL